MHLRQVVELASVGKHCEFTVNEGAGRVDLTIQLPGGRHLAVDAKAPVGAYLESLRLTGEEDRERKLEEHAVSLRGHIENLRGTNGGAEFTVAYVPNEAFLSAALDRQPGLIEEAAARQIFFASPASLIALLKVVAHGWQQERLADDTRLVRELGQDLYDRLVGFSGEMETVSQNLSRTVESYNRAVGTLENRVLRGARRFARNDADLAAPSPVDFTARVPRELQASEDDQTRHPLTPAATGLAAEAAAHPAALEQLESALVNAEPALVAHAAAHDDEAMVFIGGGSEPVFDVEIEQPGEGA
jgi:DNA recombination protein RmuC